MQRRWTMLAKRGAVLRSCVTLVLRQAVLRIDLVPFLHPRVAVGFRQNRSRGNGDAACIAMDERFLFDQYIKLHGVQQQIVGDNGQLM